MSSKISINPEKQNDPNYRYKMPEIKTQINGSGTHGSTSILTNIDDLSSCLRMPKEIILQYIGKLLGTNVTESINGIKGRLNQKDTQVYIYKFIKECILCQKCNLPELYIQEVDSPNNKYLIGKSKKRKVNFKCASCGNIFTHQIKNGKLSSDLIIRYLERNNNWIVKKDNNKKTSSNSNESLFGTVESDFHFSI